MSNRNTIFYGFISTIAIFFIAILVRNIIDFKECFVPNLFFGHVITILLSCIAIWVMKKNLNFHIALPKIKKLIKLFFIGVLLVYIVQIPMNIIVMLVDGKLTPHPFLLKMNVLQAFLFVFISASIAEEILFRGFLKNSLNSLSKRGVTIFKSRFSLPVIISAAAFSLAHLTLIFAGVNYLFLIRIVLFTFILGTAAGYYQEKYENNTSYAIIVHMGGNLPALLSVFIMTLDQ